MGQVWLTSYHGRLVWLFPIFTYESNIFEVERKGKNPFITSMLKNSGWHFMTIKAKSQIELFMENLSDVKKSELMITL